MHINATLIQHRCHVYWITHLNGPLSCPINVKTFRLATTAFKHLSFIVKDILQFTDWHMLDRLGLTVTAVVNTFVSFGNLWLHQCNIYQTNDM